MSAARQVAVYLAVSLLLFWFVVMFLYLNKDVAALLVPVGAVVGMVLSVPICRIYIYLYQHGYIEALRSKKQYIISSVLMLLFMILIIPVLSGMPFLYLRFDRVPLCFSPGTNEDFMLLMLTLIVPFFLVISPLSFVIHDKLFAKTWFFFLCIIFSIPLVTIPFLWIPMIVYYPLLIKFTSRARKNLG
jgi:hypothetical protein